MSEIDFLSYSPVLTQILEYLSNWDVVRCMTVNRRFYDCINIDWSRMAKAQSSIELINQYLCTDRATNKMGDCLDLMLRRSENSDAALCSIWETKIVLSKNKHHPFLKTFLDNHLEMKDTLVAFQYTTSSVAHGVSKVFEAIIPRIDITTFVVRTGHGNTTFERNLPSAALKSIRDTIKAFNSTRARNLVFYVHSVSYSPLYSDIIEQLGDGDYTFHLSDSISNVYPHLTLELYSIKLFLQQWKLQEIIHILKDWQAGKKIRHLKVHGQYGSDENTRKWAELIYAFNATPISGAGYRNLSDERFEIRRQCDNNILDVTYYRGTLDLEEISC